MKYTINLLSESQDWEPLCFNGVPMSFSSKPTVFRAIQNSLGQSQQVLYGDNILAILDGTPHNLAWFMDNHDRLMYKRSLEMAKTR